MKSAYTIENVRFAYSGPSPLLDSVDLEIPAGRIVAIVGPNGAGKSTLLRLMTGLLRPERGRILLQGNPLQAMPRREIARTVAVVPQGESSAFPFTVEEIVQMGRAPHLRGPLAQESEDDVAISRQAIRLVGLEPLLHRPVSQLSGGERQLVLIARAFAQQTPILLLDEPTASLDLAHQQQILRLVVRQAREQSQTVVLILHDLNLAVRFCDEIVVLHEGRVAAHGTPEEILQLELLERVYAAEIWTAPGPDGHPIVGLRP
ncbi:heme ABC transporter ATP-binding protein [bacterium]|nr:heme ABC transporter ATP-binding protein [bacterium]